MSERVIRFGFAAGLFILVLVAYIETMAGSSSFWDAGEFIASAYSLGIPHPPATPLYVVLGRVFSLLPLPLTVAAKINFMSAFFGALGVTVLFLISEFLIRERRGNPKSSVDRVVVYGAALVGALFTAWGNTYWNNAVEAEVYAISSFVMGVTTLLALRWSRKPNEERSTRYIYLIIYLLSLGVGFHLGTVLTFPAIALYLLLFRRKSFKDVDLLVFTFGFFLFLVHVNLKFSGTPAVICLLAFLILLLVRSLRGRPFVAITTGLFVLGITIHLFLMIRSGQNPAIDEANPENFTNLMKVLRREQYPPSNLFERKATWHFQVVEHFWRYTTEQWQFVKHGPIGGARSSMIPILLGLVGLGSMAWTSKRSFVLFGGSLLIMSAGLIVFLNFSDHEVRERDYFYSGAFYFFGIFIAVGLAAVLDWFFGARGENRGGVERFGHVGGIAVFLLLTVFLYQRYHFEHDRTHERVPWGYGYNMLAGLEPDGIIFTNGDNDTFPLWYQQEVENFRKDVRVVNLSLLNTSWYPSQLRDNSPIVALTWTDREIENLPNRCYEIYQQTKTLYQPRDLAVRQIIRDNVGKKEIYFAVTIPRETMKDYMPYLVLEGVVYHFFRDKPAETKDYAKIAENVDRIYRFDGILDSDGRYDASVYRDSNQETLVQNYAGAFIRLGQRAEEQATAAASPELAKSFLQESMRRYEQAYEISPKFAQLGLVVAGAYLNAGKYQESIRLYEKLTQDDPENQRYKFDLARAYLAVGRNDEAAALLLRVAENTPGDSFFAQFLVHSLWYLDRPDEAQRFVDQWTAQRPGNQSMVEFFAAVKEGATKSWDRPGVIGNWEDPTGAAIGDSSSKP